MYNTQIEQYKKQSVESMTAGERLILLYDTAIKNLKAAVIMLENKDMENFLTCVQKSRNIFFHLETVLDPDIALSEDLAACYGFWRRQIGESIKTREKEHIEVIIPQIESLRDGFEQASHMVARGN